ncbi:MAG: hypothetical protein ACMUHB_05535 [Thermoplasmatota archaeon]
MAEKNFWPAIFLVVIILIVAVVVSIDLSPEKEDNSYLPETKTVVTSKGEMEVGFRMGDEMFQVLQGGEWNDILIKGVNLGITSPGHFPGEAALTEEQYSRWFRQIGEMNANAIRIYTIHPPAFYKAFYDHNRWAPEPLYLFHGAWVPEEYLLSTMNAFNPAVIKPYYLEIERIVDIVHGDAEFEWEPGHAYGKYEWDISKFVMGYILGIEWEPQVIHETNLYNRNESQLQGEYFFTETANPFEIWNARALEHCAGYEALKYNTLRPIAFSNWPTTDPLPHPSRAYSNEDLVSIDPNNISTTADLFPGQFASYHIYPYYPDFISYDLDYRGYRDPDGDASSYAGYLHQLREYHHMPVLVAEFGIPSSRGMAHRQINNMTHGGHTEEGQAEIDSKLYRTIVSEGYAGGLLFSWQDEWFKNTWSTYRLINPERRPYWSDAMTCEQAYGVLAFDPGSDPTIIIDGFDDDWEQMEGVVTVEGGSGLTTRFHDGYDLGRSIERLSVASDEKYVYFLIEMEDVGDEFRWEDLELMLFIDSLKNQGLRDHPSGIPLDMGRPAEFVIHINGEDTSRVLVDSYYDAFHYLWGQVEGEFEPLEYASQKNNGTFHPVNFVLSRKLNIQNSNLTLPFDYYQAGLLRWGISDPEREEYDSLADIYGLTTTNIIELRVPWLILNFRDPSKKEVHADIQKHGLDTGEIIEGFHLGVISLDRNTTNGPDPNLEGPLVADSIPDIENGVLSPNDHLLYTWEDWDEPEYRERLKSSYYVMRDVYASFD